MINYEVRYGHKRTKTADGSRRRDQRRSEAEARQAKRNARTPQEQLVLIDQRLGINAGATKERSRLRTSLTETAPKKSQPKTRREKKKARKQ